MRYHTERDYAAELDELENGGHTNAVLLLADFDDDVAVAVVALCPVVLKMENQRVDQKVAANMPVFVDLQLEDLPTPLPSQKASPL